MEEGTDPLFVNNAFQPYGILMSFAIILTVAQILIVICWNNPKNPQKVNQI